MGKILIANWKMNLSEQASYDLARQYTKELHDQPDLEIVVAPSFPCLYRVGHVFKDTEIHLAAQDVAIAEKGAYTGGVSASMLAELDCRYSLVGHSERRQYFGETDEMIQRKLNQCYAAGITPVLCIGENALEKSAGQRDAVLAHQLKSALENVMTLPNNHLLIAYEPIWAIGTGNVMESEEMQAVDRLLKRIISSLYSEKFYDEFVRLLYGGSVSSINAGSFWAEESVDGLLVASASLEIDSFVSIAEQGRK